MKPFKEEFIKNKINKEAVDFAEEFGMYLAGDPRDREGDKFTSSQFRNVFGEVKRIQMKGIDILKSEFLLLRPKVAYSVARKKNDRSLKFKEFLDKAHIAVDVDKDGYKERFKNFCDLFEAILAYHKANGGKD